MWPQGRSLGTATLLQFRVRFGCGWWRLHPAVTAGLTPRASLWLFCAAKSVLRPAEISPAPTLRGDEEMGGRGRLLLSVCCEPAPGKGQSPPLPCSGGPGRLAKRVVMVLETNAAVGAAQHLLGISSSSKEQPSWERKRQRQRKPPGRCADHFLGLGGSTHRPFVDCGKVGAQTPSFAQPQPALPRTSMPSTLTPALSWSGRK